MNATTRYTAFDPEIFLNQRLRQHEHAHFAATHGLRDQLESPEPTAQRPRSKRSRT